MAAPAATAIEARDLSYEYPSRAGTVRALTDVSLTIAAGEFVSLLGPSGCGKTTFLRAVAGLLPAGGGALSVFGAAPAEARATRALGLITQDPGLLPWRTVQANVELSLEITGGSADVPGLLARVGIQAFAAFRPRELSGGMRQRVALARALAHSPRLLLMDEPFGALDELSREELRLELLRIWERDRVSVLFVTHSIREAILLSDRVLVMSRAPGRVVANIAVALPRPRDPSMELDPAFARHVHEIRNALSSDGVRMPAAAAAPS
jgi:NitT/TauT family transport system ATP-binding protein